MTGPSDTPDGRGLNHLGDPLGGTDARPEDAFGSGGGAADVEAQGGENEQQDALRAHARAQGADAPVTRGLEDTRASADLGSINDNSDL